MSNEYYILNNDIRWMRKSNPQLGKLIIPYIVAYIYEGRLYMLNEKTVEDFLNQVNNNSLHYVDGTSFQDIDSFVLSEVAFVNGVGVAKYCQGMQELCEDIAELNNIEFEVLKIKEHE
jgi:hypothetical protein